MRKRSLVLITIIILLLSSGLSAATPLGAVEEVRQLLLDLYVDTVPQEVLNRETIEEIIGGLNDPHTTYMTQETFERYMDSINQNFYGVGIYMEIVPEGILITSVIQDSPGKRAGLLAGDIVVKVDGVPIAGLSLEEVSMKILGERGTVVELEIHRDDGIATVSVVRGEVKIPYVDGVLLEGNIGYIAIASFGSNVGELFELKAMELKSQGAKSWIIDVRNNGGGYLQGALDVLGNLVPNEKAMVVKNKDTQLSYFAPVTDFLMDEPVILLVNNYSASASEIVGAALKDHKRAFIMGENSYGKGSVQNLIGLDHGGVLKMTTWRFFSPFGRTIDGVGVSPHIDLATEHLVNVGEILLSSTDSSYQMAIGDFSYNINLELARTKYYWRSYRNFLGALNEDLIWPHYYPNYHLIDSLEDISPEKVYQVEFNMPIIPDTIHYDTVELIDSVTGERVAIDFYFPKDNIIHVAPKRNLQLGKEYWLTIQEVKSKKGGVLTKPVVATIKTTP